MSQHAIDLLPAELRARSQAGIRTGRCITNVVIAVIVVIVATSYMRVSVGRAKQTREVTHMQANFVLATEARAADLRASIRRAEKEIEHYRSIALPVEISGILATLVNQLPDSMTLESVNLDAAARRDLRNRRQRIAINDAQSQTRSLNGEISGFAATDEQITALVDALSALDPFGDVNLDFTRSRVVRNFAAREFRISFEVDLDQRYAIETRSVALVGDQGGE